MTQIETSPYVKKLESSPAGEPPSPPLVPSQILFVVQPAGAVVGSPFATQPVIEIADSFGNRIASGPDSMVDVTVANDDSNLQGTLTVTAVAGVATFTDLRIDVASTQLLHASALILSSTASVNADSGSFDVIAATASQLAFKTQPANAVAGFPFGVQPVVQVEDAFGNVVAIGPDSTVDVTVEVQAGVGTLAGTMTVPAVGGVAVFSDLWINARDDHGIRASTTLAGPGAVTCDSALFTVVASVVWNYDGASSASMTYNRFSPESFPPDDSANGNPTYVLSAFEVRCNDGSSQAVGFPVPNEGADVEVTVDGISGLTEDTSFKGSMVALYTESGGPGSSEVPVLEADSPPFQFGVPGSLTLTNVRCYMSGNTGYSLTVSGTGFEANKDIIVWLFDNMNPGPPPAGQFNFFTTDANGAFTFDFAGGYAQKLPVDVEVTDMSSIVMIGPLSSGTVICEA